MFHVDCNGLKKRDNYDEKVNYVETDRTKIRYPDRRATFIEQSHYKMLGGGDCITLQRQQDTQAKQGMKDAMVRYMAAEPGVTKSIATTMVDKFTSTKQIGKLRLKM